MKKILFILIILISAYTLSGCYDSKDIDEMVYVVAIGIDEAENNNTKFTLQLALPLNISGGVETGFATEQGSAPLNNISVTGHSIYSATDKINMNISKEINISHCKLILFSENAAKGGLDRYKDILLTDKRLRPNTYTAVCSGNACDYLAAVSSPHELNPARYYDLMFNKSHSAYSTSSYLKNIFGDTQLTMPLLSANKKSTEKNGTAIFKDLKMTGALSPNETVYFKMLKGTFTNASLHLPDGEIITVHQRKAPSVRLDTENKNALITLHLYGQKSSGGSKSAGSLSPTAREHIADSCGNIVKKTVSESSDILGLKAYARRFFLTENDLKNYNFDNQYKNYNINVYVE